MTGAINPQHYRARKENRYTPWQPTVHWFPLFHHHTAIGDCYTYSSAKWHAVAMDSQCPVGKEKINFLYETWVSLEEENQGFSVTALLYQFFCSKLGKVLPSFLQATSAFTLLNKLFEITYLILSEGTRKSTWKFPAEIQDKIKHNRR